MSGLLNLLNSQYAIEPGYGYQMAALAWMVMNRKLELTPETFGLTASKTSFVDVRSKTDTTRKGRVAVMTINGPLFRDDQFCGPKGMLSLEKELKELEASSDVDAIVLDMLCPGGQVPGTETLANTYANIKKPKVAFGELIASGALYIASGSDHIMLSGRNARIGSLGSALNYIDITKKLEKEGIEIIQLVADTSPDKNLHFRNITNKSGQKGIIKETLNPLDNHFMDHVRAQLPEASEDVMSAKVFFAEEAIELGLAHSMGTLEQAIQLAFDLSEEKKTTSTSINMNTENQNLQEGNPEEENLQNENNQLNLQGDQAELVQTLQSTVETQRSRINTLEGINDTLHQTVATQRENITQLQARIDQLEQMAAADEGDIVATDEDTSNKLQEEKKELDPMTVQALNIYRAGQAAAGKLKA